ncbi:diacylglycerol kinase family lipid kinase [Schnuerera sp. xch1]|uniref:diacylglycerol/lipid kinase family protein n=1 Tax=Schnuerera sp. xch1 TaxID=2874283 RepID=UPI001CBBB0C8|nr:diacylglycerol kinase family protein [Schnuerera sp. xch1]MBZ2175682.1 diacylglycerol kinase family lipid kinase [Schnuerera sp. xch1]
MDKILFIINPVAGGGKTKSLAPIINKIMKSRKIEYNIIFTTKPKEATEIARSNLNRGYTKIVAVGGDGTINEVAVSLIGSDKVTLGIIPSGTGNDLARTLDIPNDPKKSIDIIIKGKVKKIDVGTINNKIFLNISSIGFDSEIAKNTEKVKKKIKSSFAYIIGFFISYINLKDVDVKLKIDEVSLNKKIFMAVVGNGKYYGGGRKILPMANIEDGFFDVCVVKKMPKLKLILFFITLLMGMPTVFKKNLETFRAKSIKIVTKDQTYLNIDGEIEDVQKETFFTMQKEKLQVLINE